MLSGTSKVQVNVHPLAAERSLEFLQQRTFATGKVGDNADPCESDRIAKVPVREHRLQAAPLADSLRSPVSLIPLADQLHGVLTDLTASRAADALETF